MSIVGVCGIVLPRQEATDGRNDMPIEVIKDGERTKIVGSETYANGMTLKFCDPDDSNDRPSNYARLLDMKHARSWLANDGVEPVYVEEEGDVDMGGRGKTYSVGASGRQVYISGRGKVYEVSAAEAELRRKGVSEGPRSDSRRGKRQTITLR